MGSYSHHSPPLTPPPPPPSWIKYNNMSSSSTLNTIRTITSTIWSIRSRHQASRILRTTHLLLRCFLFFDICYLLSGISLIVMALTEQFANKEKMILFGGLFGVFASVSALCNSLASHGVRTWKRGYLLPWLAFFTMVMVFLLMELGRSLYFDRAEWRHVFLLFAIVAVFSCWRHMHRQFLLMSLPRPESVVMDVESVMRELLVRDSTSQTFVKDAPPKYEGLETVPYDEPPQYDENTMKTETNTCDTNRPVQNV